MKPINTGGHSAYQDLVLNQLRKYYPDAANSFSVKQMLPDAVEPKRDVLNIAVLKSPIKVVRLAAPVKILALMPSMVEMFILF